MSIKQLTSPLVIDGQAFYPQTCSNQVVMEDGSPLENAGGGIYQEIVDLIYPVGSIYISLNAKNPGTLFNVGAWEQIAQGRTLFGADGSNYVAGQTVEAGLPNITGTFSINSDNANAGIDAPFSGTGAVTATNGTGSGANVDGTGWHGGSGFTFDASKSNSIYGNSETVQPPALVVYMWKRVS